MRKMAKSANFYGLFIMSSLFLIIGSDTSPIGRNREARGDENDRGSRGRVRPTNRGRQTDNYSNQDTNNTGNKYKITTELNCQEYLCKYGYLLTCNCVNTLTRNKRDNSEFRFPSEHLPDYNGNIQHNSNSRQQDSNLPACEADNYAKGYRDFQKNYHLSLTSVCDHATKDMMSVRRCGQPDIIGSQNNWDPSMYRRERREAHGLISEITGLRIANQTQTQFIQKMQEEQFIKDYDSRPQEIPDEETEEDKLEREKRSVLSITVQDSVGFLTKSRVTWRLMQSHAYANPQWSRGAQISILKQAFKYWSDISPICFVMDERSSRVDISVGFLEGRHLNCFKQFDGPGREVAHKWFRDVHFDNSEQYLKDNNRRRNTNLDAISLKLVAVHEIGHVLGLNHSRKSDSVMNAIYKEQLDGVDFSLNDEDRGEIKRAYGKCTGSFDAVFDYIRNDPGTGSRLFNTFFFRNDHMWMYENPHRKAEKGHPLPVGAEWNGVPSNIDTFMHIPLRQNGKIVDLYYFFKGNSYYKFDSTRGKVTTQNRISTLFKAGRQYSIPSNLDTAYYDVLDKRCYFLKDQWVYTYDCSKDPADSTCCVEKSEITAIFPPKALRELSAPDGTNYRTNIDSVYFSYHSYKLYIFKGKHVWVSETYNLRTRNNDRHMKYLGLWNDHWHFICDSECT